MSPAVRSLAGMGLLSNGLVLGGRKDKTKALTPCAPALPSRLEVRSGDGALELAVKPGAQPSAFDLCDAGAQRIGGLAVQPDGVTLSDGAGAPKLKLVRSPPLDVSGDGPRGQRLRVHLDGVEQRVLKPDGVPFGAVTPKPGGANVHNPASQPVARVEPRGDDQVIAAADGKTVRHVVPAASSTAAAAFAIEGLTIDEQLALYWLWASAKPDSK